MNTYKLEIQNEKYQKEKIVNSQYPNSRDPDGYLYKQKYNNKYYKKKSKNR